MFTVNEYVRAMEGRPELMDRLAQIETKERERKAVSPQIFIMECTLYLF